MKKIKKVVAFLLAFAIILSLSVATLGIYAGANIDYGRDSALFLAAKSSESTEYYAQNNLGEQVLVRRVASGGRKEWQSLYEMGELIKNAFISVEDRSFYTHHGVNIRRTLQAALKNLFSGTGYGASTITQQVVKNISGDNERSFRRKLNEILRAIHLESEFSKDEILEIYLNIVPMSGNIYGVSAAADAYFGCEVKDLTASQAATIVGMTNSPAKYDPVKHPEAAKEKRNKVLYAMADCGVISTEEYERAKEEEIEIKAAELSSSTSSWYIESANKDILADIRRRYSVSTSAAMLMLKGAKIYLCQSIGIQRIMEEYFEDESRLAKGKDNLQYSMVVIDNSSGNTVGIIGGRGEKMADGILSRAETNITPASALKPFSVYAPLIEEGRINMATLVEDAPLYYLENGGGYPKNSPNVYDGFITLSDAVRRSKNTVALRLLDEYGIKRSFAHLKEDLGFSQIVSGSGEKNGVSDMALAPLGLGQLSEGVSIRQLTESYTVFPSLGELKSSKTYYAVFSSLGELLVKPEEETRRIYKESTAKIMTALLEGVTNSGTASSIRLKEEVDTAGKTGTSGGDKDRLFVGFTPYYTAGIWCGYDVKGEAVGYNNPSHLAIWDDIMTEIHRTEVRTKSKEYTTFNYDGLYIEKFCCLCGGVCEKGENCEYGFFVSSNQIGHTCMCKRSDEEYEECEG